MICVQTRFEDTRQIIDQLRCTRKPSVCKPDTVGLQPDKSHTHPSSMTLRMPNLTLPDVKAGCRSHKAVRPPFCPACT